MSTLKLKSETKVVAYFCPECGSASVVHIGALSGLLQAEDKPADPYECRACGWAGIRLSLLATEVTHEFGSDDSIATALMADLRTSLAKEMGTVLVKFLLKWGFMPKPDTRLLARYLTVAGRAMLLAIITERAKIDGETSHGN
jgi:predicted RNA-binding Zn-ribbon protein involved in translation (DUF1610 family)